MLRGKPRPGGMLHSYPALRWLVMEAGFSNVVSHWAVPDTPYRHPTEFVLCDASSIRAARKRSDFVQGSYRKAEVMFKLTPDVRRTRGPSVARRIEALDSIPPDEVRGRALAIRMLRELMKMPLLTAKQHHYGASLAGSRLNSLGTAAG
jgi:hypothetical protein